LGLPYLLRYKMKTFIFASLFFFIGNLNDSKIELKIDGNPACLKSGQVYKMDFQFPEGTYYDNLIIRGRGVLITHDLNKGGYSIKANPDLEEVSVIVSLKNSETNKLEDLQTFELKVCQEDIQQE